MNHTISQEQQLAIQEGFEQKVKPVIDGLLNSRPADSNSEADLQMVHILEFARQSPSHYAAVMAVALEFARSVPGQGEMFMLTLLMEGMGVHDEDEEPAA